MFNFFKRSKPVTESRGKNPYAAQRSFFSQDANRLMPNWVTSSVSIDRHLQEHLTLMRARSRELARQNPFAKKFTRLMSANIVGPNGVGIDPQVYKQVGRENRPDALANDAITKAFNDWAENHCDFSGVNSFIDIQSLAACTFPSDGEFIFEEIKGRQAGKYGYQLRVIDAELLDVHRNQRETNGNITRLGVERDQRGRPVRYWFREVDQHGNYHSGRNYSIEAENIIHCFFNEFPDQSRGIPWMSTGIERMKMIDGYEQAAIVAARAGAAKMGFFSSKSDDPYTGETAGADDYSPTITEAAAGTFEDIGDREFQAYDPKYPHEQYASFMTQNLQAVSAGWGISHASLSNNLSGVNYSSIRSGVMDDRELFKIIQNWFIRTFVGRVYKNWLTMAVMRGEIKINGTIPLSRPIEDYMGVKYQPKRWAWVDPLKDMQANKLAEEMGIRSPIDIIIEEGRDPEKVLAGYKKYIDLVKSFGLEEYINIGGKMAMPQKPQAPIEEDAEDE
jgi:lambda family phage portal protein